MNNPIVSIIVPFFNAEANIKDTVNSVLFQTYSNLEIILVDDGSTDHSSEIIQNIAARDERVKLTKRNRLPKSGSTCRNIGASIAKGEYLIFLDADDVLAEDCIENRLKAIEGTNYSFVVFPMASFSDTIEEWTMTSRLNVRDFKYFFASGFAAWQVTSPIWRKDYFVNVLNGFDESFQRLQDIELHLRAVVASEGNYMVMRKNRPDCFYRKTPSDGLRHHKMIATLTAYEKFSELLENTYNKGALNIRRKFSGSIVILYLTMLTTVNLLYQAGVYDYDRQRITCVKLHKYLTWYDKLILNLMWHLNNPKSGALLARAIRRLCQYRFL